MFRMSKYTCHQLSGFYFNPVMLVDVSLQPSAAWQQCRRVASSPGMAALPASEPVVRLRLSNAWLPIERLQTKVAHQGQIPPKAKRSTKAALMFGTLEALYLYLHPQQIYQAHPTNASPRFQYWCYYGTLKQTTILRMKQMRHHEKCSIRGHFALIRGPPQSKVRTLCTVGATGRMSAYVVVITGPDSQQHLLPCSALNLLRRILHR